MNCLDDEVWNTDTRYGYYDLIQSPAGDIINDEVQWPVDDQIEAAIGVVVSRQLEEEEDL